MPGSSWRRADVEKSMGYRTARIFPSPSVKIRLLYLPMISAISLRSQEKPISSRPSKVRIATRSKPACRTPVSFAPCRCLRSSMQSIGGTAGFSFCASVKQMRGAADPALISSRLPPS